MVLICFVLFFTLHRTASRTHPNLLCLSFKRGSCTRGGAEGATANQTARPEAGEEVGEADEGQIVEKAAGDDDNHRSHNASPRRQAVSAEEDI